MNRLAALAIFTSASAVSFSGVSYADSLTMNNGPEIEKTLLNYNKPFAVKYLDDYDDNKLESSEGADAETPRTDAGVQHIQSSIDSNKALVEKLESRGVAVKDIVNAEQAADGTIMFSVK